MRLSSSQREKLARIFASFEDVLAVYVFGSAVTGRPGPEPDLDLAVVSRRGSDVASRKLEMLTELVRHGFERVDLIFLERADPVLKHEAVRHNRLVYATADFSRGAYYSLVIREYLDILPYLERQREIYKRKVRERAS